MCSKASSVVQYGGGGVTERMVKKMEMAELEMMRWALEVTLEDRVRNEYIWGTEKIRRIGEKLRGETEMVQACEEKGRNLHRQKNDEN